VYIHAWNKAPRRPKSKQAVHICFIFFLPLWVLSRGLTSLKGITLSGFVSDLFQQHYLFVSTIKQENQGHIRLHLLPPLSEKEFVETSTIFPFF
jgi:hypothetical protein